MQAFLIQVPGLHVPLMGAFRLHGQTVLASATAPIGSTTLIYGSQDGAQSFVNRHPEVVQPIVEEVGRKLGIFHSDVFELDAFADR